MEALGQLTGGIAHDFNNLLTVVVGGLDIIAKRAEDAKLQRYAENALAAAERGARLTGQLLAFSRVQRLEVRPTQVAPLIQNMRPLLRNVLGPGIEKRFDLDQEMLPVMADPTQLEVAVLNLAINARDAMPDGGVLSFATRKVEVRGDPELDDGCYIELTISDTGAGMTEEVAARAFEPFFTTKEVGKGTGLGLSMVYGMARQSGGAARIESAPGEGTAVKLYFRAARSGGGRRRGGRGQASRRMPTAERPAASVLVIDDDPDVRGFIVETLEEQGYQVREASDGRAGLAAMAKERPDLVVLDFIMPGLSGAEVANRILAQVARPADPVRLRLQRDRGGQARRPRRAAADQAVPRRRARQGGAGGAGGGGPSFDLRPRVLRSRLWRCRVHPPMIAQPLSWLGRQPSRKMLSPSMLSCVSITPSALMSTHETLHIPPSVANEVRPTAARNKPACAPSRRSRAARGRLRPR